MAKFQAKPFKLEDINNGNQFEKEGITPNAINAPIEASALMQSLATNQPNNSEVANVGTPKVEIESTTNGYRFKFSNLRGATGATGPRGYKGEQGEKGEKGNTGSNGKSAYDIAVENGFKGSETEWLESLKGADGASAEKGEDGKSAYDIWLEQGNTGTEADFLESLKGPPGPQGPKGDKGDSGTSGADDGYIYSFIPVGYIGEWGSPDFSLVLELVRVLSTGEGLEYLGYQITQALTNMGA